MSRVRLPAARVKTDLHDVENEKCLWPNKYLREQLLNV